jgi:hypothetical protein
MGLDASASNVTEMERRLLVDKQADKPLNTDKAYDPKLQEFMEFCEEIFPSPVTGPVADCYMVTEEKVFQFTWYQTYREQRQRGGRQKHTREGETVCETVRKFNKTDYDKVVEEHKGNSDKRPKKPVGESIIAQNISAIVELLKVQRSQGKNNRTPTEIRSSRVLDLFRHVQKRKVTVSRANYEEKVGPDILPYVNMTSSHKIEQQFWSRSQFARTCHNQLSYLRNRAMFLDTMHGILRGESCENAELSDNLCVLFDNEVCPTPYLVMIMQILFFKQLQGHHG